MDARHDIERSARHFIENLLKKHLLARLTQLNFVCVWFGRKYASSLKWLSVCDRVINQDPRTNNWYIDAAKILIELFSFIYFSTVFLYVYIFVCVCFFSIYYSYDVLFRLNVCSLYCLIRCLFRVFWYPVFSINGRIAVLSFWP